MKGLNTVWQKLLMTMLVSAVFPTIGEIVTIQLGVWTYHWDYQLLGVPIQAILLLTVFHTGIFFLLRYICIRRGIQHPVFKLVLLGFLSLPLMGEAQTFPAKDLADQVLIHRTPYGVPHIRAENMEAAGYAMGYLQMEDYGSQVAFGLIRARGEWARFNELQGASLKRQIDEDAASRLRYARAVETFPRLAQKTRDLLRGFAQGINRYIELHPEEFPDWLRPDMTAYDVHARSLGTHNAAAVRDFVAALQRGGQQAFADRVPEGSVWSDLARDVESDHPDEGSNVWALAPERTVSGHAILMRNPHLSWTAGYYEAHMTVAGELDFYGDFRIGDPLGIVGGFNAYLGWATTNNNPDPDEIYAFALDPARAGHYLLDGRSHAFIGQTVLVEYNQGASLEQESRQFLSTPFGPVIYQDQNKAYIIRSSQEGEYRINDQFLRMMAARNLEEWKDAMRMQARHTSNFTYADRDGNIFYVWNGSIPDIRHASGGDTAAVYVERSQEIWTQLIAWDDLPQLLNPKGGYVRNENDPFHFTNLHEPLRPGDFPAHYPPAQLRLRGQLSLMLIGGTDKLSLEEVLSRKHDMRAILADRVKEDLIRAVERSRPDRQTRAALQQLKNWDNTVSAGSRGGILFETWWNRYVSLSAGGRRVASTPASAGYNAPGTELFSHPWSADAPDTTPEGLANPLRAVEAFVWAIRECNEKFGTWDLAWGDVHRAKIGDQDYAVGGATGDLGAFRVLWFDPHKDDPKKRQVRGGDGWVLAVEFGEIPRAYSVLAYGQSIKENSPYYADQLKMFVDGKMKPVYFTKQDIERNTIKTYHPGKK